MRRLVREAAEDDAAEGSGWLEIQVDPSSYAARFGGITAFTSSCSTPPARRRRPAGVGIAVVVAANRTRHPLDARTLARLAAQYAGPRRGRVRPVQRRAPRPMTEEFAPAFRIAAAAGLLAVPHGGELRGARQRRACLDELAPDRLGHGVRAGEDPALLARVADAGVTLEVCPASNVALGRVPKPRRRARCAQLARGRRAGRARRGRPAAVRLAAGRPVRDRAHGARLGRRPSSRTLARQSVARSAAPPTSVSGLLAGIDAWLAASRRPRGANLTLERQPT